MSEHPPSVLDDARLAALVEEIGDADLVRETVSMFLDELPARLARIRAAVAVRDRDASRAAAHALGSPAAMLGVTGIARATKALEAAAPEALAPELDALVIDVDDTAALGEQALRSYLAESLAS